MADNGGLVPFVGTWDAGTFYLRGSCVLRSGVLYQARSDRNDGRDPAGGGPYWENMAAVVVTLTGSIDPTAGSGIPAAVGSSYQQSAVGLLTKTGAGATDWTTGEATLVGVTISETDPGAIGAGNIWLREYDDTAGATGHLLYQTNIRNAADDGWVRPEFLTIVDGVLRARVTLDDIATGGDIEVRDASGTTLLFIAWDGTDGDLDITNNAADSSWFNHLKLASDQILIERNLVHAVTIDDTGVSLSSFGGQVRITTLPTSDPVVPYALYVDAGVVKMSAP